MRIIPDATAKDFYELELASSGITRSFMARSCDLYFTIEAKLRRYLSCCLTLYHVPEGKQQEAITTILNMNLRTIAEHVIENTITRAEDGFEAAIHAKKP